MLSLPYHRSVITLTKHAANSVEPTNSSFPAAPVDEVDVLEPVAVGLPVPEEALAVLEGPIESVALALADLPVYLVVVTPLPLVHS